MSDEEGLLSRRNAFKCMVYGVLSGLGTAFSMAASAIGVAVLRNSAPM